MRADPLRPAHAARKLSEIAGRDCRSLRDGIRKFVNAAFCPTLSSYGISAFDHLRHGAPLAPRKEREFEMETPD